MPNKIHNFFNILIPYVKDYKHTIEKPNNIYFFEIITQDQQVDKLYNKSDLNNFIIQFQNLKNTCIYYVSYLHLMKYLFEMLN